MFRDKSTKCSKINPQLTSNVGASKRPSRFLVNIIRGWRGPVFRSDGGGGAYTTDVYNLFLCLS